MIRSFNLFATTAILGAMTACLSGCGLDKPIAAASVAEQRDDGTVKPDEVFQNPSPTDAGQDPRVVAAGAAADLVKQSLAVVHKRLADLKASYETKAQTEEDLRHVAQQMQPLVAAARTDCDAILRAARDLNTEYPFAKDGYEAAANLYRERGLRLRDADLREVQLTMAAEFDRLAGDVPRRNRLTADLIEQLLGTQEFLAEADRCLRDTAAAFAILSAGPDAPRVSPQGRAFRRHVEEFITVVEEYQRKLLSPAPPNTPRPGPDTDGRPNVGDTTSPPNRQIQTPPVVTPLEPAPRAAEEPPPSPPPPAAVRPVSAVFVRPVATPTDFLRPGVTLKGVTVHAGIVIPATLWVGERSGDEIAGYINFSTVYGPGRRRFLGRFHDGNQISLRGDRVGGNILPSPCFYQGRVSGSAVEGSWASGGVEGSFWFTVSEGHAS